MAKNLGSVRPIWECGQGQRFILQSPNDEFQGFEFMRVRIDDEEPKGWEPAVVMKPEEQKGRVVRFDLNTTVIQTAEPKLH